MKKTLIICSIALLVLMAAPATQAQDDYCFEKGGVWDAETESCIISGGLMVNITYPLTLAGYPIVESTVDAYLAEVRTNFVTFFAEGGDLSFMSPPWELSVDYAIYNYSEDILSLQFLVYEYTGGVHGNLTFRTFTFDVDEDTLLTLEDFFADGVVPWAEIGVYVQNDLAVQLGDFSDADWVASGTGENPDNYQNFAATPEGLIVFFPPYQVAPYAAGPMTVVIPWENLSGYAAPN